MLFAAFLLWFACFLYIIRFVGLAVFVFDCPTRLLINKAYATATKIQLSVTNVTICHSVLSFLYAKTRLDSIV